MREELQCNIYAENSLGDYKYVVICSYFQGKWLLSKHRERETWEMQGGHIETGETPHEAAKRELYEESGVRDANLYYICDYEGYDSKQSSNGAVFLAIIHEVGKLPESEMEKTNLFDKLPHNLTYPCVAPVFVRQAEEYMRERSLGDTIEIRHI
ncbi:MAG: NUDIX domain-containing protein [Lachnospiraceae bacterium]|nr:NUDIX domain-containing protein [Lachnospiraceae bacterium]